MSGHSQACCSLPVAQAEGYTAKGQYDTLAGLKYYATGPTTAKKAIFYIFDIFGYTPQTIQGADILTKGKEDYLVLVPDLWHDSPADPAWFADKAAHQEKIGAFLQGLADPAPKLADIDRFLAEAKSKYPSVERWGTIGYCYGGKLVSVTSGENTKWNVGIQTSPAQVNAADAAKITIPQAMLASKDEPAEDVKAFEAALKTPKHIEIFDTQIHGFMSARADLKDPEVKKEYERGYQVALDFFAKHL